MVPYMGSGSCEGVFSTSFRTNLYLGRKVNNVGFGRA